VPWQQSLRRSLRRGRLGAGSAVPPPEACAPPLAAVASGACERPPPARPPASPTTSAGHGVHHARAARAQRRVVEARNAPQGARIMSQGTTWNPRVASGAYCALLWDCCFSSPCRIRESVLQSAQALVSPVPAQSGPIPPSHLPACGERSPGARAMLVLLSHGHCEHCDRSHGPQRSLVRAALASCPSLHPLPSLSLVQAAWEAAHRSELRALATAFRHLTFDGTVCPLFTPPGPIPCSMAPPCSFTTWHFLRVPGTCWACASCALLQ